MKIIWDKIYELELGESMFGLPSPTSKEKILRVPGGWVYTYGDMQGTSSTFIPYSTQIPFDSES